MPLPAKQDPVCVIQQVVAKHWGLQVEDLTSAFRKKSISFPRQIAIYLIRQQMHMSFNEIGWHFGQRDHTTILHSYRKIDAVSGANKTLQETLKFLHTEISLNGRRKGKKEKVL